MADGKATEKNTQNSDVTTIGVNKGSGKAFNAQNVPIPMSMPCIVILVHGVNDVGEAFQHQDRGICAGLNERLDRKDLTPHTWEDYIAQDVRNTIPSMVEDDQHIKTIGHSPIIPFYWGYRPVDEDAYLDDDTRYYKAMFEEYKKSEQCAFDQSEGNENSGGVCLPDYSEIELPYDAYVREASLLDRESNYSYTDQFFNYLDSNKIKNGGLFANATTCIPDMYGPGSNGLSMYTAKWYSRINLFNNGDYSHPIYDNSHRIYQVFAAQRLADLIIDIRSRSETANDAINIVAHSQGTIITMLANFMVKQEKLRPADCVIFNHSPYSLESRFLEDLQPGYQQTTDARVQTLANFCQLMRENKPLTDYNAELLSQSAVLGKNHQWDKPEFSRNNFGKVYSYFCPNDQTVSLKPIQGFGWQGIPDDVMAKLGENFRQRVFYQNHIVGNDEYIFSLPYNEVDVNIAAIGAYSYKKKVRASTDTQSVNADFGDRQRTINGEALPESFTFQLMSKKSAIGISSIPLTMSAIARDDIDLTEIIRRPWYIQTKKYSVGDVLSKADIKLLNDKMFGGQNIVSSVRLYSYEALYVSRLKTVEEIRVQAESVVAAVSQHSSIVVNEEVSQKAMAYDLAIGDCNSYSFNNGRFWLDLLKMADWRDRDNPLPEVTKYFQTGILPPDIKALMNKPHKGLPSGVVNLFDSDQLIQWDPPSPLFKLDDL